LKTRVHHNPGLDPNNPDSWPPLLRERDIVKDPRTGYAGLLPITSTPFRDAVARGDIDRPVKFGRINTWTREHIRRLQQEGIPRRPIAAGRQDRRFQ
jgi:hypothetical protein